MKAAWFSLALLALSACSTGSGSGGAFSKTWQSDAGASITKLEQRLRSAKRVTDARVAVGVTEKGVVGIGLDGSRRWAAQGQVDVLPAISGNLLVTTGQGRITGRDVRTGKALWQKSARGMALRGAADDGTLTVVVAGTSLNRSRVLTINHDGEAFLDFETSELIGQPAALDGYAFLPWASQYISVLDMKTGAEVARLLLREQVSHAKSYDGDIYFGELGLTRFDKRIGFATSKQGNYLRLPERDLPGKPVWLGSGTERMPAESSARTKIRIYARPVFTGDEVELASDSFAATYFRVAYGLSEKDASLRWVKALPSDVVGGAAASSGFALCGADGKVWLLGEQGTDAGQVELGDRIEVCAVATGTEPLIATKPPQTLAEQLRSAFEVLEPDMAVAQRFLLSELGKLTDPLVTKLLIDLSSSPRLPPEQRDETRTLLAGRRNGAEYMLSALERHYDFVSGVLLPPPVGPLADALAAMGEKAAAPLLARHLNDPANSALDVKHAAIALRSLASEQELEELRTFFALYRATADSDELVQAVIAVGAALIRIGGDDGRELAQRAARDPLTHPEIRRALTSLLPASSKAPATADKVAPE